MKILKKSKIGLVLIIFSFVINISCTNSGYNNHCYELYSKIQKVYNDEKENYINLKQVFKFEWDTLHVIISYTTKEVIKEETGINYNYDWVPEGSSLYLFVSKGKLVSESISECDKYYRLFKNSHLYDKQIMTIKSSNSNFKIL